MGDALAICLLEYKGFSKQDFAKFHPGGILGKKLTLTVKDLININKPLVNEDAEIKDVIIEISKNRLGATAVCNADNNLVGIITDGDLRRCFEKNTDFKNLLSKDIMTNKPRLITSISLVYDAFQIMKENNITQLIVSDNGNYIGIIHLHDIIKEGIVE